MTTTRERVLVDADWLAARLDDRLNAHSGRARIALSYGRAA